MIRPLLFYVLLGWTCAWAVVAARADEVRYTFSDPGPDWAKLTFDAHDWKTAPELPALAARWHEAADPTMWVRLTQDITWQQINNAYFRATHDGPMEIFVNGTSLARDDKPVPQPENYLINPMQNGAVGHNVFGLRFAAGPGSAASASNTSLAHGCRWRSASCARTRSSTTAPATRRFASARMAIITSPPLPVAPTFGPGRRVGWRTRASCCDARPTSSIGTTWAGSGPSSATRPGPGRSAPSATGRHAPSGHPRSATSTASIGWLTRSTTPRRRTTLASAFCTPKKPEGPWQEVTPDHPIVSGYDPSLFRDDDGKVYLIYNRCSIARLKNDLSGPAEPFRTIAPSNYPDVGFEGPCVFKYKGRYFVAAAEPQQHADGKVSYDCVVASADHIYGPYGPRYIAIRYGGHNGFFLDKDGQPRATVWKLPGSNELITIPRIELSPEGLLRPVAEDCLPPAAPAASLAR